MTPDDLAAIRARAEDARRNRESYSKNSRSRRITNEESATDVPALLAEVERLRAGGPWTTHVEKMRAMREQRDGPCICDTNPETTDGPDEECPWHGRPYAEWVARGVALAAKIERVEALATECEGQHGQCWNSIFGQRIRAALADPKEDT